MRKFDSILLGTLIGIVTSVIAVLAFYIYFLIKYQLPFNDYVSLLSHFHAFFYPIISLAGLPNLLIFYLFLNKEKFRTARGIILATFIIVAFVVVIKFW